MSKERSIATLTLDGGILCFHFINTVNAWRGRNLHEYLGSYPEFILWCRKVNIISKKDAKALLDTAVAHPAATTAAYEQIIKARAVFYQFFAAMAAEKAPSPPVLQAFNQLLSTALAQISFYVDGKIVTEGWTDTAGLLSPLRPVLKSAYELLTREPRERIKECGVCGWMFLDQTKNNKRRWCSPQTCGSVEKSRKYYQKKKEQEEEE